MYILQFSICGREVVEEAQDSLVECLDRLEKKGADDRQPHCSKAQANRILTELGVAGPDGLLKLIETRRGRLSKGLGLRFQVRSVP